MPAAYTSLKDAALECIDNVKFDEDARKVFKTARVQEALDVVMALTIKTLEYISSYLSKSKLGEHILVLPVALYSLSLQNVSKQILMK